MIERRQAMLTLGSALIVTTLAGVPGLSAKSRNSVNLFDDPFARRIAALEAANGGRLGVAVLDTSSGARFSHRGDERFPMCSTFKFLLAAATLARVDRGQEKFDRRIRYAADQIVTHSPVTSEHVGAPGLTVGELCAATMTTSDNTAANLLLTALGGPTAFNAFARNLGDRYTRIDRIEPWLNEAMPGDLRDTTTPAAMLGNLRRLLTRSTLTPGSRDILIGWLVANQTGGTRLRAGVPADWRVGDKTGAGERGTVNDIGILWPAGRAPILVASYLTASPLPFETNSAVHADVARAIAQAVSAAG
ncbi:class A beta-lactamase [Sphingomonas cavernae]|uniref:Beta-lactamase n=1 Tax=Sphingomonas cavernae TaxID=2320861 RepID=A0A418W7H8_9SPHN|nr:class A beta-lactamase [Sphingomonas cavernae]RJF85864.1 class A beta-lactamase [Sphingomonas cavernae]